MAEALLGSGAAPIPLCSSGPEYGCSDASGSVATAAPGECDVGKVAADADECRERWAGGGPAACRLSVEKEPPRPRADGSRCRLRMDDEECSAPPARTPLTEFWLPLSLASSPRVAGRPSRVLVAARLGRGRVALRSGKKGDTLLL